jgi:hypothetical protein
MNVIKDNSFHSKTHLHTNKKEGRKFVKKNRSLTKYDANSV